jgi:hypothetical protein
MGSLHALVLLMIFLITAISTFVLGMKMRRRIRRALGRDVNNEIELTSLKTWINVQDEEDQQQGGKSF